MFWALPAGLGLIGAIKGYMDSESQNKQRREDQKLNAVKSATLPWLHIQPGAVTPEASGLGGALGGAAQGAITGALFSQALEKSNALTKLLEDQGAGLNIKEIPNPALDMSMTNDYVEQMGPSGYLMEPISRRK